MGQVFKDSKFETLYRRFRRAFGGQTGFLTRNMLSKDRKPMGKTHDESKGGARQRRIERMRDYYLKPQFGRTRDYYWKQLRRCDLVTSGQFGKMLAKKEGLI